jgi:hypothetical protein
LRHHEAETLRRRVCLRSFIDIEFGKNSLHVRLDCLGRNAKIARNFLVRLTARDQVDDVALLRAEQNFVGREL